MLVPLPVCWPHCLLVAPLSPPPHQQHVADHALADACRLRCAHGALAPRPQLGRGILRGTADTYSSDACDARAVMLMRLTSGSCWPCCAPHSSANCSCGKHMWCWPQQAGAPRLKDRSPATPTATPTPFHKRFHSTPTRHPPVAAGSRARPPAATPSCCRWRTGAQTPQTTWQQQCSRVQVGHTAVAEEAAIAEACRMPLLTTTAAWQPLRRLLCVLWWCTTDWPAQLSNSVSFPHATLCKGCSMLRVQLCSCSVGSPVCSSAAASLLLRTQTLPMSAKFRRCCR